MQTISRTRSNPKLSDIDREAFHPAMSTRDNYITTELSCRLPSYSVSNETEKANPLAVEEAAVGVCGLELVASIPSQGSQGRL